MLQGFAFGSKNSEKFFSSSWLERFIKTSTTRREALPTFEILMNHSDFAPPLRRPHNGIVLYYLYTNLKKCGIFLHGNTGASHCAPSPLGDWWRKRGVSYSVKTEFCRTLFSGI